jgi:hypothetical protein
MPKIRIELEVADSGATAALKNYGRAAADAFSQIKAGDPASRSATVRVNDLTRAKTSVASVAQQWSGA